MFGPSGILKYPKARELIPFSDKNWAYFFEFSKSPSEPEQTINILLL